MEVVGRYPGSTMCQCRVCGWKTCVTDDDPQSLELCGIRLLG
jgi:hypothetical protein